MRKIISLICVLSLLVTSVFTVNMSSAVAADSELMSLSFDFEGYKGYDNLSVQSLRDYGGKWDSYQIAGDGVTGVTDVATDRGTSLNIINRAGSGKDYVFVRPCLPESVSTSLKIKFSFNFRDLVRGYAVRLNNSQVIMQNIYNKVSVMGNAFSQPAKTEVWYDFDISLNLKNGYYVASITSEGRTETFEGIYSAAIGKSYNFMDMGYYGGKGTLELNNLWLDDLYFAETEDFCKSALSESDFASFEADANGSKVPEGFSSTGISAGVNGFYSENGKLKVVTGNTTPLTLEKTLPVTDTLPASVFGTVRVISNLNLSDNNADRSFMIGSKEIAKFGSDGTLTVGDASASYEANTDYKVSVKIDTNANKAEVSVSDENGELAGGEVSLSASDIKNIIFKTVQTSSASEAYLSDFSVYNGNGLKLVSSNPEDGSKNIKPQNITFTFSNPVESVEYITLGGDDVSYELTAKNEITVYTASVMEYGKEYVLDLSAVTDIFGESKNFSLKLSTIEAKTLGKLSLEAGENITASVTGVSNDGQDYGYTLVLVQYNETNNMLIDLTKTDFTLEEASKKFTASLVNAPGSYYEAYLWDSFDAKNALCDKITFGTEPFADAEPGNDGFSENMDTGVVTGSNLGIKADGHSVLIVLKPGKTPEDIKSAEKLTDVIDFIKQFDSKETDVISYTPSAGNGMYSYVIDGSYVEDAFDYIDPSYVSMVYDEINKDNADFVKCISDYNKILVCDTTELDIFDDDKKSELNSIILAKRDELENKFETIASFHDAYYHAVSNILVKYSDKASDVQTAFEKYGKEYGIENLSTYKTYAESNDTAKAEVYAAIANAGLDEKDTFEKVDTIVSGTIVFSAIRNSQTQVQIGNIIAENNDSVLGLDLSDYNKVTNKSALHTKLIGANVYNAEEFKTVFDKAVSDRLKEEENEKDVSEGIVPAGNSVFHDFETYVGNDETLSIQTLQNWTTGWGAYGLGEGVAGPTSVKTDRGNSLNIVNRDQDGKYGSAQVRPAAKEKIETSLEIKVSIRPIEFNVSAVIYFFGDGSPNQLTAFLMRADDNNINVMGTILGFKPVADQWYDIEYKINKVSGYFEATVTCGENSQTVKGVNEVIKNFKTFNSIGVGYSGNRRFGDISNLWIDDISIRETEPFCLTMDEKSDFESFTPGTTGITVPEGFEASGTVKDKNGFYSEEGTLVMKTATDGELSLKKKFDFKSPYTASVYGNIRTEFELNIPDANADRIIKIGETEVAKFGSDGKFTVAQAQTDYETGKDYKVIVKADSSKLTDDKGATYYNKVTVIVTDENGEVFNGTCKIPDGTISNATLSVVQKDAPSETLVKAFDVCTDNGFFIESASPASYETNVIPGDAEFVFSNSVEEIGSVTLNDAPVQYEFTSDKSIKVKIKDELEYNKKYVINITGAKDKFGETKDFKHTFYTVYASSLSDISIKESTNITASVSGFSYDGNKYNYTLILASFDAKTNKLINIAKTPVSLGASSKDYSVSLEKTDGAYYEAYVWDSVNGMGAVKDKATFGTNELADVLPGKDGYVQNMDTGVLTATNTGINKEARNTLLVLKPGKNMNDVIAASKLADVVEYIGQFDGDVNDVYAFTPSLGGKYGVAINGVFKSNAFTYVGMAEVESVFQKLNEADTSFVECINNHNNVLQVNTEELSGFDDSQKSRLEELISEERAKLSDGFKTCADFEKAYDYAVARVVIETAESAENIKIALEKYGEGLGMKDFVAYKTYDALSAEGKKAVYSDLVSAEDLSTVEKIEDEFAKAVILRAVQYAGNYVDIKNIISDNNDYLDFDLKEYNSLDKQSAVNKALIGNYYQTISKLESEFDKEVSKQKKAESGSGSNGSSTGGSSGSSKGFGSSGLTLGNVTQTPVTPTVFTDLENHLWAKEAIESLASKGVIAGRSKTVFDPGASITREEFTKIIVCAFTEVDTNLECNFSDVSKDTWYYSYVATAQKIGLISGTSATTFGTGEKITRQDMAVILYRACEIFGIELSGGALSFVDANSVSDYAKQAVASLAKEGIINGKGNNCFEPRSFATRAESAKMIYETLERGDK